MCRKVAIVYLDGEAIEHTEDLEDTMAHFRTRAQLTLTADEVAAEIWLPVPGTVQLEASNMGRLRTPDYGNHTEKMLSTPAASGMRYISVRLSDWRLGGEGCSARTVYVHDLIARAFIGEKPEGYDVRHLDGCTHNNRATNLAYGTRKDNMADARALGTLAIGSKHGMAKLNEEIVLEIRACGLATKDAAKVYGVSESTINQIRNRTTWRHI